MLSIGLAMVARVSLADTSLTNDQVVSLLVRMMIMNIVEDLERRLKTKSALVAIFKVDDNSSR